jgi:hypothetical protein
MTTRLLLLAHSSDDVGVLSALTQDAAARVADVGFDVKARRLALLLNRYRWEAAESRTRVRSALRFDSVLSVQRKAWPQDGDAVLALLAVQTPSAAEILLDFGGGAGLRLIVECVDATLEDISDPWRARAEPSH